MVPIGERIMWKWTTSCKSENLRPSRRIRYERSDLLFCFHHPVICRKPPHVYSFPLPSLFHRTSVQNIEIPFFSTSQLPIPHLRSSRQAPWLWCPTQLSPACQISCQIDLRLVAPRSLVPSPPCAVRLSIVGRGRAPPWPLGGLPHCQGDLQVLRRFDLALQVISGDSSSADRWHANFNSACLPVWLIWIFRRGLRKIF
jgi:hypothetical protein